MEYGRTSSGIRALALFISFVGLPVLCLAGEESERGENAFFALRDSSASLAGETSTPPSTQSGGEPALVAALAMPGGTTTAQFSGSLPRPISIRMPGTATDRVTSGGQLFTMMGVSMFAASAGDLLTTEMGLSREGIIELNPTQANRWARVSTHVAVPAFLWWITDRAHDQGKTKLAWAMRVGFSVAYGYIAMRNGRTIGGVR